MNKQKELCDKIVGYIKNNPEKIKYKWSYFDYLIFEDFIISFDNDDPIYITSCFDIEYKQNYLIFKFRYRVKIWYVAKKWIKSYRQNNNISNMSQAEDRLTHIRRGNFE